MNSLGSKGLFGLVVVIAVTAIIGRYYYKKPAFINGEYAADFTGYMPNGDAVKLSDLKGKFVLLDFWGSWCPPCIKENPELIKLHEKYGNARFKKAEGFEIFSVGIEDDKKKWLNAIKKYGLDWKYHVSDFKNLDSDIAKLYGVRVIPSKFLINDQGIIMGVNLPFEKMDELLARQLKLK